MVWKLSFLYMCFIIIFKFTLSLDGLEINEKQIMDPQNVNKYNALFTDGREFFYEALLFIAIFIQIALLKRMGSYEKNYIEQENVHQTYIRKKLNDPEF